MSELSTLTAECLREASWNNSREVDTSGYKAILEAQGYQVFPAVLDFLKSFGGLKITHPHHSVPDVLDDFHFNPAEAIRTINRERVEDYANRIGSPLCVIGEAYRGHMVLLMDAEGTVYAGYDDFLIRVGKSGMDAIEAICTGREMPEVP